MKRSRLTSVTALLFLGIGSVLALAQKSEPNGPLTSANPVTITAGPAVQVTLADLPTIGPAAKVSSVAIPLQNGFSGAQYKELKDRAAQRISTVPIGLPDPPPILPLVFSTTRPNTPIVKKTFLPPNTAEESTFCNASIPSDMGVAANTSYLIQLTNSCITVLNPNTGVPLSGFPKALSAFFGLSPSDKVGDPRALYDSSNQHFLVVAEDFTTNILMLAASQSSNPTLGWNIYSSSMGGSCGNGGDFPMLGQSLQENGDKKGGIYLSWNVFDCKAKLQSTFVLACPKTLVYAGSAVTCQGFKDLSSQGLLVDTVQPANVMNKLDRPRAEFLVNSFNMNFGGGLCVSGCNGIVTWSLYNGVPSSGSSPTLTGVVVSTTNTYYLSPGAPQPGCASGSCLINTGDPRIGGEVTYSSGSLYATLNDQKGILWLEMRPTLDDNGVITAGQLLNEECFACGGFSDGGDGYYGTIQPDSEGNWTMVYNFSSPVTFPSSAYLSRRVTQAKKTHRAGDSGFILTAGQALYQQLDDKKRNRWGDYTAVSPTLLTPNSYWFAGEFSEINGNWGTAIGRNGYAFPTDP